jgi:NAD(P)-dependent dehydrogenase (short-subunit alcohol dehydrogenase family)
MVGRLQGKRVIVTGAASGIGRASAMLFAREGARVLIVDWAEQALEETVQALRAEGHEFASARADSGREEDVRVLIERAAKEFGGLDAVFANAGIARAGRTLQETTVEQFQEVMRVNLLGPFLAIKHGSLEIAKQGKGAIVCTSSVAGLAAHAGPIDYSASKAGLINLVRTAAHDLRGTGVRVNAICPGLIDTGMTRPLFEAARLHGFEDKIGQFTPLQRAGQSEEIAAVALFLISDESSYVDGHALVVDGGLTASVPHVVFPLK